MLRSRKPRKEEAPAPLECARWGVREGVRLGGAGRTGELARAFGIDFESVLTRGSQYRVEAMMARLAHTQNYLLPTPSKAQVPPRTPTCTPFPCMQ